MACATPKQYLPLAGRTVIEHTLAALDKHPAIAGIVLVLSPADEFWSALSFESHTPLVTVAGGSERHESVLNGLRHLRRMSEPPEWVLVHDAARPCLRGADLDVLIARLSAHAVGGVLGVPVSDTMKRVDGAGDVVETLPRAGVWRALTPQMFRLDPLTAAIERAMEQQIVITDEAGAMELAGHQPHMVEGCADNIKITTPRDLELAELLLRNRGQTPCE